MKTNYKNKYINTNEESDSETEDNESYLKTIGNNIYFHCEVNKKSVLKLIEELTKLKDILLDLKSKYGSKQEINIYIHSDGGDLFAGLSAMHHIENLDIHVNTIVDGVAISAASFILLGGHTRKMFPYSMVLIHQLKTGFWGTHQGLMDEMKNSDLIMNNLKKIYTTKTNIKIKKLNELLKRDLYLTSHECLDFNIVNEII
tara:strand:- start:180 stop:782 length:603 start_codon:yes stop_codon:yes gene_type:complete